MAVVSTNDNSLSERQAQALITLLETFQPRIALKPFLTQLKAVVKDLELVDELPDAVLTCPTSTSTEKDEEEYDDCVQEEPATALRIDTALANRSDVTEDGKSKEEEDNNDDEVSALMNKLKFSQSFSPQNSVGSTTVLRSETFYLDNTSVNTKSLKGTNMEEKTFRMKPLSPTKRPRNENLSPNKPPTPMKSNSWKSPSQQSRSPTLCQSPTRCGDRYHEPSRFLDSDKGAVKEVFETYSILAHILEFDGSLAAYHKNYDLIEGYRSPYRRRRDQSRFQRRPGSKQLAFVNKTFHSLIIGPEGLNEWKNQARLEIGSLKRIARQLGNPSPLGKIFAIVIRNDAIEFEYLLLKHVTSVQNGTTITHDNGSDIFGMALKEYVDGIGDDFETGGKGDDTRNMGLPYDHPFLKFVKCWQAKEFYYTTLLAELAYNAVVCGAHDVLRFISSRHKNLYSTAFGSAGKQNLLGTIVAYACSQPCCLEEISQGIRILMMNQHQRGSHGNTLHIAAAKGDRELVDALLDVGCDPTKRCDEKTLKKGNDQNDQSEQLWYPDDWARVRGHTDVVQLLVRTRKQLEQQRQQVLRRVESETTAEHTLLNDTLLNDEITAEENTADYDTITANESITADYDSNSSCTSDYDSEYDSEDEQTYDTSACETEDQSAIYNHDRYRYKPSTRRR